ncbi:hypothetical protein [Deinococcus sp.]|uniref:hypothetical protein n=1 Tax=Deinococcus sp. TaxID=47478 RepID=UPI003B5967B2
MLSRWQAVPLHARAARYFPLGVVALALALHLGCPTRIHRSRWLTLRCLTRPSRRHCSSGG